MINFNRRFFLRILFFSSVWFALTGVDITSWVVGVPAVLIASGLSLMLAPPSQYRISLVGVCRFIPFFLRQSLHGGIDVMRRALSFRQLLDPGLVSYTTFLPEGSARILFANTISLLPGTLSAELDGNSVTIHTLDRGLPIWANIQGLEYHIAALMRISPEKRKNV
jgi:multicomponent Na+:H+ antiporter subunit E